MTDPIPPAPLEGQERTAALRNANACQQMADLCTELLGVAPDLSAREFLRSLGALVAGIDLGIAGIGQLARGGSNGLVGAGFRAEYDDGTAGQARHFAGTAAAAALLGDKPAEVLAHHVVDPADSIDGRLSTAALEFARLLIDGDLPLDAAGQWIEANICDPEFAPHDGFTPFDVFGERSVEIETIRTRFTMREWQALCELPEQVAIGAALAEATGDLDDARDLIAGIRRLDAARDDASALVRAIVAERLADGLAPGARSDHQNGDAVQTLSAVREQLMLLRDRGVPVADIDAYANLVWSVANQAVRGSKSGGVFGLGGQRVSAPEAEFLSLLESVLEANLPGCDDCLT